MREILRSSPLVSGLIQWALRRPSDDVGYEEIEPIETLISSSSPITPTLARPRRARGQVKALERDGQ